MEFAWNEAPFSEKTAPWRLPLCHALRRRVGRALARWGMIVSGDRVLVEECLVGEEASLLCLCDGRMAMPLPSAQDHKAAHDGDHGPNTGGMGAYSPAPVLPDDQLEGMADKTVRPILAQLEREGHPIHWIPRGAPEPALALVREFLAL